MRAVLDTNILVRENPKASGAPAVLLVASGEWGVVQSES